ncbi:GNAT family N-acetyltransferase [Pseudoalteromonas tunicata]|uniref:GNAT family N-acetyltransferase n=1 Tax=Pseudoalteromonas tunicata TaxID=314281 RepID=UPI00273FF08F|nr:GNAT family N-acetyltransferase [Pseudoalteromonas tunicata]MDP4982517.1 GNAT family N-acetyltransferase [Pseudoalteromonas tunicata]
MIIEYQHALTWFETLPAAQQYPTQHPVYIANEVAQLSKRKSCFLLVQSGSDFLYLAGHVPSSAEQIQDFESVRGYGGVITNTQGPRFAELFEQLTAFLKALGFMVGFIRCTPLLANQIYFRDAAFFDRKTVAIALTQHRGLSDFSVRARTAVRKAIKNQVVATLTNESDDWQAFYHLYNARMQALGATDEYCYSAEYFAALAKWPLAHLCVCKVGDEIVSGAIFIAVGDYVEYHLSASNALGMKYASTQLCLATMSEYWSAQGHHFLHLGGGITLAPDDRLLFFKAGFSELSFDFCFVKWLINETQYLDLKADFENRGLPTNRVIFYR